MAQHPGERLGRGLRWAESAARRKIEEIEEQGVMRRVLDSILHTFPHLPHPDTVLGEPLSQHVGLVHLGFHPFNFFLHELDRQQFTEKL